MKFRINQAIFDAALATVGRAISSRIINPILSNVKFEVKAGQLDLSASDGDLTIKVALFPEVIAEGAGLVPGQFIINLVGRLSGTTGEEVVIEKTNGRLNISAAEAFYTINILDVDTFPELPEFLSHKLISLPSRALKDALNKTTFAAIKDGSERGAHYTNGILFAFRDSYLDVVSTDGHRLALKKVTWTTPEKINLDLLVPQKTAEEVRRILTMEEDKAASVFHFSNQIIFMFDNVVVASNLLDLKFPDYNRVVPKEINSKVEVARGPLRDALQRELILARTKEHNPVTRMETTGNKMAISSNVVELGSGNEGLSVSPGDKDIVIAFNPEYLVDMLGVLDSDSVVVNWVSEVNPLMFTAPKDPDFTYILMPIRI